MELSSRVLSYFDISDNIAKGVSAIRHIRGIGALALAFMLLFIAYHLAPIAWYFDIDSTREFGTGLAQGWRVINAQAFGWGLLGVVLVPTLIEIGTPIFARKGIVVVQWVWWLFVVFDALTDNPRVEMFLQEASIFQGEGPLNFVMYHTVRVLMLIFVSLVVEMYIAVACSLSFVLLMQTIRREQSTSTNSMPKTNTGITLTTRRPK